MLLLLAACGDRGDSEVAVPEAAPPDSGYATTLARLPVSFETAASMSGTGSVTARVSGDRLVIEGAYLGLESAATEAHLYRARPGLRGPAVAPLELAGGGGATEGTVTGSVELTDELRQALEARELYVQIHSAANPDGVLRGWLFPGS
jgi:hypothetical protein